MSHQTSTARTSRVLPALAIMGLAAGFLCVVRFAGDPPPGLPAPARAAIAATAAGANDAASPATREMPGPRWWGMGSRRAASAASRGQEHRRGEPSGKPGERRDYLLRSAAFARQRLWMAKAVSPEFS